ncbi:MAG: HEAT repeat domain-containing protein [Planctomycetes bacterium]|nr:HEAT repeat domain-containing protein [Planctomycetota bacterium]
MRTLLFALASLFALSQSAIAQTTAADWAKQLRSKDSVERLRAANELGKLGAGAASAVAALGTTLGDEVPEVRNAAADALAKVGKPAVAVVGKALADEKRQLAALRATGQLGAAAVELLPAVTKLWPGAKVDGTAISDCLRAVGEPAIPHLITCLSDHAMNLDVCNVLRHFGPNAKAAVPALLQLLDKRGVRGAEGAAEVLGKIGDPRAVPALLAAVERSLPKVDSTINAVGGNAMRSLGEIKAQPDKVVPLALRVIASERRDQSWLYHQRWAIDALQVFDARTPEVLAALRAFLAGNPGENKPDAERVLKALGG